MTVQTLDVPTVKTQADIEELKRGWRRDPCWDIEQTDGFEAHRYELLVYRLEMEATCAAHYKKGADREWLPVLEARYIHEETQAECMIDHDRIWVGHVAEDEWINLP